MAEIFISWEDAKNFINAVKEEFPNGPYYGVPSGGSPLAALTGNPTNNPEEAEVILDDVIETGTTKSRYDHYNKPFRCLIDKTLPKYSNSWITFPWEKDSKLVSEEHLTRLLSLLGQDVNREGLVDTPKRWVKFMKAFLNPEDFNFTTFKSENYSQMIVQTHIPFYSLCEHHLLPFFGEAHIAYIPDRRIVGLSKLARTVQYYSSALQNQERITEQVADKLTQELAPKGVAVILKARHMCMEMRGAKSHDTLTTTSSLRGLFLEELSVRQEFLNLIK